MALSDNKHTFLQIYIQMFPRNFFSDALLPIDLLQLRQFCFVKDLIKVINQCSNTCLISATVILEETIHVYVNF
jgi:hypothetical protein